ncbi:MAG: hypothetical protein ACR2M3_16030 [Thermomicrobiales bacterium]
MTFQEMITEIPHLSHEERLALLEALYWSLRAETAQAETSSLLHLRGVLKPDTPLPSTYDYTEEYANYVIEKYR